MLDDLDLTEMENVNMGAKKKRQRVGLRSRLSGFSGKGKLALVGVVLVIAAALGGYKFYNDYQNVKKENARLSNPQEAAQAEASRLQSEVGAFMELPNETPTIATVVDVNKLKSQAFFANAQNGDRVLMFPQAKKAILYRPGTKKIVEVAPINLGNEQGVAGQSTTNPTTQQGTTQQPAPAPATNNTRR